MNVLKNANPIAFSITLVEPVGLHALGEDINAQRAQVAVLESMVVLHGSLQQDLLGVLIGVERIGVSLIAVVLVAVPGDERCRSEPSTGTEPGI